MTSSFHKKTCTNLLEPKFIKARSLMKVKYKLPLF